MYSKDRCEEQTKEGCGRVVAYRTCNVIFSYTMECGYHTHTLCQELPKPTNVAKRYGRLGYTESESENFSADIYKQGPPLFTPQIMEQIGRALCVTVLDIFDINPYSRLPNTQHKTLEGIRRETALQLSRNERFRKEDAKCQTKIKRINESIFESYYKQFKVRKVFDVVKKKKPVSVFSGLSKINLSESQGRLSHFSRPIPPFNQNSLNARTEQSNEF